MSTILRGYLLEEHLEESGRRRMVVADRAPEGDSAVTPVELATAPDYAGEEDPRLDPPSGLEQLHADLLAIESDPRVQAVVRERCGTAADALRKLWVRLNLYRGYAVEGAAPLVARLQAEIAELRGQVGA